MHAIGLRVADGGVGGSSSRGGRKADEEEGVRQQQSQSRLWDSLATHRLSHQQEWGGCRLLLLLLLRATERSKKDEVGR